jgi:chitinase
MALGTYFANWAKYRKAGYDYEAADLAPIASRLSEVTYMAIYFCPPAGYSPMPYWAVPPYGTCTDATEFEIMSVEPSDDAYLQAIVAMKASNPSLQLLLTLGGWNFPSAIWSAMAATNATRAKFIASAAAWIADQNVDGIDLDCA